MAHLIDEEKNADVKSGVALVLGALPRDRVLKNVGDAKAQEAWRKRLLSYEPAPAAAPMPEGAPKPEDK